MQGWTSPAPVVFFSARPGIFARACCGPRRRRPEPKGYRRLFAAAFGFDSVDRLDATLPQLCPQDAKAEAEREEKEAEEVDPALEAAKLKAAEEEEAGIAVFRLFLFRMSLVDFMQFSGSDAFAFQETVFRFGMELLAA